MADDIDDLLDEVETKFCTKSPVKGAKEKAEKSKSSRKQNPSHKAKKSLDDDLNDMINDICDVPEPLEHLPPAQPSPLVSRRGRKCFPVFLGGVGMEMGVGSSMTERSCNMLRCTSCDFKVVFYNDFEWDASCDYLFFRNNVPDFKKLSAKLKRKKGSRAYACQCTWRSILKPVDISEDSKLKWVCGGKHS